MYICFLHHEGNSSAWYCTLYFCRCLTKNTTAVIQIEVSRPVCMELYQDCRELGRFMLRSGGATIAAGVVTKVRYCDHCHHTPGVCECVGENLLLTCLFVWDSM